MGQEIVYCNNCQTRLLGSDFDKGKAFRVEHQNLCLDCAQKLLGTLPPAERDAFAAKMKGEAKKHSTVKIPVVRSSSDSGGHSRLMRAAHPDSGAPPAPRPKRSPALVFALVGGVVALLVLGIVASSSSPSRTPPPPPDSGGGPPPPPLPPSPGGNASADARRDLEQARAWAKANPDDFAGQIDRYQKTAWRPDAGAVAEEAKREVEAVNARQAARITRDLADLDQRVRGLTDRGEHGVAMKAIEADRARHATQDWTLALKRRSDAVVVAARARAAELRTQAAQSRNDASALRTLRDRTATLGFPEFLSEFDAAASATPPPPVLEGPPVVVYDDGLGSGWVDWSWNSVVDLKAALPGAQGRHAAAFTPKEKFAAIYFGRPARLATSEFSAVSFRLYRAQEQIPASLVLYAEDQKLNGTKQLAALGLPPVGQWKQYVVPIADLNFRGQEIKGVLFQSAEPSGAPMLYVDDVLLLRGSAPPTPVVDATPPPTGEAGTWRTAWLRAAGLAAGRDYAAAEKELAIALPTIKDAQVKADAARDLADLKAAGVLLAEALQALAKWPRGMNLAGEVLQADGTRRVFDEPLRRVDGTRLELRGGEVEVGDLLASGLAAIAKPKDPRAAGLFCAIDGDLDGARRLLGAEPPSAYLAHAATLSTEIDARRLWTEASAEWRDPSTRVQAAGRYASLLRDHASSLVVRRNRASIAARAEPPRDFWFTAAELRTGGAFLPAKHPKGEVGWTMSDDSPKRGESWVEAGYSVNAGAEVHAFVLAGACCLETWSSFLQASDLEGPDPESPTSLVSAEPGAAGLVPIPISLPFVKRTHALHGGGPKAPTRFEWLALPVLKHAQGGPKRLRVIAEQQGFTVIAVLVSTTKRAAPKEAELKEIEAARPSSAALVDGSSGGPIRPGGILREVWTGIGSDKLPELLNHPNFKGRPNLSEVVSSFEAPRSWQDSYGTRMRGWVVAPATGAYQFTLCSDDQGELWLGTDESPSSKQKIAWEESSTAFGDWKAGAPQASREINLVRGRLYYIEALQKEGMGDDHLMVGWRLPDGTPERPIPGRRLVPWAPGAAGRAGSSPPAVSVPTAHPGGPVTLAVDLGLGSATRVEFFNGATRLGEAKGSPPTFVWTAPPVGAHLIGARVVDKGKTVSAVPAVLPVGDVFLARLIDLNGPHGRERVAVVGTGWERTDLELRPHVDGERAELLRSSVAAREGTKVEVGALPDGKTLVYLLAVEFEAAPQAWDLAVNGKNVLSGHRFTSAGEWARLGPFAVDVAGGKIELAASKGLAHFAGLEIWTTGAPPKPQNRERTATMGGPGGGIFDSVREGDPLLVGFKYTIRQGILKSVKAMWLQGEKTIEGEQRGEPEGAWQEDLAKPGYAVGGLQIMAGADRVRAARVVYMRVWGGRLNPADRYEGPWWLGDEKGTQMLAGDGAPVVGIHGGAGGDIDRLGLIYLR